MDTISFDQVAPVIRYVNNVTFDENLLPRERIIYDHEFIYCVSGETVIYYDGKEYSLNKGDLFYLRPGIINNMWVEHGKTVHVNCVHFDWCPIDVRFDFTAEEAYIFPGTAKADEDRREMLKKRPFCELGDISLPDFFPAREHDRLAILFKELYSYYCLSGQSSKLKQRALLTEILCELLEHDRTDDADTNAVVKAAVQYIEMNYRKDISVEMLSTRFKISAKYFGVLFKRTMGVTVREYLTDVRLRAAKIMLLTTDSTLSVIAESVGIEDQFYFIKLFRKKEGISPGKYRNALSIE